MSDETPHEVNCERCGFITKSNDFDGFLIGNSSDEKDDNRIIEDYGKQSIRICVNCIARVLVTGVCDPLV